MNNLFGRSDNLCGKCAKPTALRKKPAVDGNKPPFEVFNKSIQVGNLVAEVSLRVLCAHTLLYNSEMFVVNKEEK